MSSIRLYSQAVYFSLVPFLDYPDMVCFFGTCRSAQAEKNSKITMVFLEKMERSIFSKIEIFDRAHYRDYWGVEITDEFDSDKIETSVLRTFLKAMYSSNPNDEGIVKDGCLIPAVVPERVMVDGRVFDFNLELLGPLAQYPEGEGHKAGYAHVTFALEEHGQTSAGRSRLVILVKEVVARSKCWEEQVQYLQMVRNVMGYECETEPDALSQNTVLFAHHAVTSQCHFGNWHGMEQYCTYGRTREVVSLTGEHMVSGNFTPAIVPLQAKLIVSSGVHESKFTGVAIMCIILGSQPINPPSHKDLDPDSPKT